MSVIADIEVRAEQAKRDLRRMAARNPDVKPEVERQIARIDDALNLTRVILAEIDAEIERAG